MKKGVLFDLDGTLWDATAALVAPWNEVIHRHGDIRPPLTQADMAGFMGKTAAQIAAMLLPGHPLQAGLEIVYESCEVELPVLRERGGILYPHLKETLHLLGNLYPLYIVSNCQEGYIQAFLAHHHLEDMFADFEYEGRTHLTKGENIRLVMERHALAQAVYVGDTQGDLDAAGAAGIPFIHAAYGFGKVDPSIPAAASPKQLPKLVARFLGGQMGQGNN